MSSVRELPTEESKEQDAGGIDICWRSAKFSLAHNLRCHIRRCSAENFDLLLIWNASRESKIYELDLVPLVEHHILKLDVTMRNTFAMQVLQGIHQLSIDPSCIVLSHSPLRFALEEAMCTTTWNILENEHNLILGFDSFVKLRNVWMWKSLHESNLAPHRLFPLDVFDLFFLIDLECDLFIQFSMHSNMNHSICTLSNLISNDVVTHAMFFWEHDFIGSLLRYGLTTLLLDLVVVWIFLSCSLSLLCVSICIIISFLGSPNVLSILLSCGRILLMSWVSFISATVGTWSILSTCFWRNSALMWVSLGT